MNTDDNTTVFVDRARPEDAAAIVAVHFAAVHQTAADWYSEAIRSTWSPPITEERVGRMRAIIEAGNDLILVVRANAEVIAFGSVLPATCQLGTLFVHPHWGGQGIGTRLLKSLAQLAQEQGVPYLQMEASLNAERFYQRNGFVVIARSVHRFRNGQEMDCVTMRKDLHVDSQNVPVATVPRS